MTLKLSVISGCVTWENNNNISLDIKDAFFATEHEDLKLIQVDSGKNFIATRVYYYSYDGNLELYYDLNLNIVEWFYQGIRKNLIINHLKQVVYFPQKQRIFILCDGDVQELYGYTLMGDCLFKVNQPIGFEMLYFTWTKDQILVVCDRNNNNSEDQYGRSRYNFLLDINNGSLSKGSLAY